MVEIEVVEKERDVKGKYTRIIEEEWAIENLICSCILFKCQCLILVYVPFYGKLLSNQI